MYKKKLFLFLLPQILLSYHHGYLKENISNIKTTFPNFPQNGCLQSKDFKNPYSLIEEIKYKITSDFGKKDQIKLIFQKQVQKGFLFVFKLTNLDGNINFSGFYYNSRISKIKNFIFSDSLSFINNAFLIDSRSDGEIFCENILISEVGRDLPKIDCNICVDCKECAFFRTGIEYVETPGFFETEEILEDNETKEFNLQFFQNSGFFGNQKKMNNFRNKNKFLIDKKLENFKNRVNLEKLEELENELDEENEFKEDFNSNLEILNMKKKHLEDRRKNLRLKLMKSAELLNEENKKLLKKYQ